MARIFQLLFVSKLFHHHLQYPLQVRSSNIQILSYAFVILMGDAVRNFDVRNLYWVNHYETDHFSDMVNNFPSNSDMDIERN